MGFIRFVVALSLILTIMLFIGVLVMHHVTVPQDHSHPIFKGWYASCNWERKSDSFWYKPLYGYVITDGERKYFYGKEYKKAIRLSEFDRYCNDYGHP